MNEDIAQSLLALEARMYHYEQRIRDLEFQVRQAHRDLERVQAMAGQNNTDIAALTARTRMQRVRQEDQLVIHESGGVSWPGRTRLS